MARAFTPIDACAIMTTLVEQITGETGVAQVDASTFASSGELVMSYGTEKVLDTLSILIGRTLMAVRPYEAKYRIINALNTNLYSNRLRKISFYSKKPQNAGDFNTNLFTNFADGYDNGTNGGQSVGSMWVQNKPKVLEMNFGGQFVWDDSLTIYEDALKVAFTDAGSFASFMTGIMTEKANDIESQKEAFNRLAVLEKVGQVYSMTSAMPNSVVNLTKEFNDKYGTSYTSEELRTTYAKEFLEFYVAYFKIISDRMTNRTTSFHWSPSNTENLVLLRHTPKAKQKLMLYSPLFTEAKAKVFPEIFNPQYLPIENGEMVDYWQSFDDPTKVDIVPAVTDTTTGLQKAGERVQIDYLVGMLFDEDALMVDYQLDDATSTPLEARKKYRNVWYHFSRNIISDPTENCIIFIMKDGE